MKLFEFVIAIVLITGLFSIMRARMGLRSGRHGRGQPYDVEERAENLRLRDEVKQLKERIQVLERIVTDKEDTLSRQIEELRDRQ